MIWRRKVETIFGPIPISIVRQEQYVAGSLSVQAHSEVPQTRRYRNVSRVRVGSKIDIDRLGLTIADVHFERSVVVGDRDGPSRQDQVQHPAHSRAKSPVQVITIKGVRGGQDVLPVTRRARPVTRARSVGARRSIGEVDIGDGSLVREHTLEWIRVLYLSLEGAHAITRFSQNSRRIVSVFVRQGVRVVLHDLSMSVIADEYDVSVIERIFLE